MNRLLQPFSLRASFLKVSQSAPTTQLRAFHAFHSHAIEPTNSLGSSTIITPKAVPFPLPTGDESVNVIRTIGKPLLVAVAVGGLFLATEDVFSVGFERVVEKKDDGFSVKIFGRKLVVAKDEGVWAGRVE